ncbi:MAG: DNRLRE domain-containing protein [Byssovorax sp.]
MDRSTPKAPSSTPKARRARLPGLLGKLLPVVAGGLALGFMGASGCGDTVDSRGEVDADSERGSLGEARQADSTPITCVTLRRGLSKAFDTMVSSEKAANNYGASTIALVGQASGGVDHFYALFKFDLSPIPANATITSANVGLNQVAAAPGTWNVHLITAPWDEATVTWNSFQSAFSPQILKSPSTATASVVFSIVPQLQAWVSGAAPNHGLLIEQPGASQSKIKTEEYVVANDRPFLAACYKVACAPNHADCNGVAADGCEADLLSAATCGSCGTPCAPPHATGACGNGVCAIGSCDLGYADCDGNPQNGCETSLTTATDCGACGVACALPGGAASCAGGSCKLVSCDAGHYDCDGNPQDGCEALPCGVGAHCAGSSGCTSQICAGGFCSSPACNDHVQNGSETGLDCGGGCPPCGDGGACQAGEDCQSLVCNGGSCAAPSCNDGIKNGNESAPDCGGSCAPCAEGQPCAGGGDCQSGVCLGGACHAAACGDGVKNGSETGVDCGGTCAPCPSGSGCLVAADCASLHCVGQVCQIPSCADGIKNGAETDVDCGGTCPVCNDNAVCTGNTDCANGVCANGHCHPATCTDGVKNGNETGVDCGGACAVPETCNGQDDDCNGSVDEGLGSTTCGIGACQRTVQSCVGGQVQSCVPGQPVAEICDGALDDDCDGVVDNGCDCVNGATQGCYTGAAATKNVGVCHGGTQTCTLGHWGACVGQVTPGAETCDGADNDCDGQTDEDLGSTICGVGACQVMVQNCVGGVVQSCVPGAPSAETCDGKDNDCNGQVDDGLPVLSCGAGVCSTTVSSCVNGVPQVCNAHAKDGVACNDGHNCTGSDVCQAGVCAGSALPAGTVCRASTGACDPAETCNGAALDCPADALASAATVCRAAVNECDVQETCTGSSAACPADAVKSAATACSSDGISCTADFCNGSAAAPACVHTPSLGCQGNPGTSCLAILNGGGSVGSGVYYIDPDGGGPIAPFQAYCEMTADGGGWTLAMRVQSANSAFRDFYSSYWTDAVLLNSVSSIDPTTDADAKYASFTGVTGTSIRGCLRNTSTGVFGCKFYSYGAAKTLRALFTDTPIGSDAAGKGLFFSEATPSSWLTMWGHNTGQLSTANCYERIGLNVDDDQSCYHARVRFGYMANNECNIVTLNDTAGFGASAYGANVCDGLESAWRVGAGLQANSTTYGTIGGIWVR